jgi:hypothetical protein
MKAVTYHNYGGPEVLNLVDLPKPSPAAGEVLVRIRATSVTSGDARMRAFDIPGPFKIPARFMLGWPTPKNPIVSMVPPSAATPNTSPFHRPDQWHRSLAA